MQASPLVGSLPQLLGTQGASNVIGTVELTVAALLLLRLVDPCLGLLGGLGGLGGMLTFAVTLGFLFSTPGVSAPEAVGALALSPNGLFLLKDAVLLAACLYVVVESARAVVAASRRRDTIANPEGAN